jgi:hypothetical protein
MVLQGLDAGEERISSEHMRDNLPSSDRMRVKSDLGINNGFRDLALLGIEFSCSSDFVSCSSTYSPLATNDLELINYDVAVALSLSFINAC